MEFAGRRIEAVLFDLDGTLIDSREDLTDAVEVSFRALGVAPPPRDRIRGLMGTPLEEMAQVLGLSFTEEQTRLFGEAFRAHYPLHWLDHTRFYEGAEALLESLSTRAALALVTTKRQWQADRLAEGLGVAARFRHVQGWQPGLRHKPAPDLPLAALRALGVRPERAVMVGDTFRDVGAGRAAGCATIAVTYGCGDRASLEALRPDALADSPAEVGALLGG
ncbi:MAG: HAD family hydrolase [Planctomycetes bacterium]|jgi:phosphoglycolate phosphatase|nr:HAD family hydrolase [Planctomycetota bacterium]